MLTQISIIVNFRIAYKSSLFVTPVILLLPKNPNVYKMGKVRSPHVTITCCTNEKLMINTSQFYLKGTIDYSDLYHLPCVC